jgi:protein O-mannosyl-transferase
MSSVRSASVASRSAAARSTAPAAPLCAALIAAAVVACYSNACSGPFVFDDRTAIVENASIRSFADLVKQDRNLPTSGRPLVALSFAANYRAGGLEVRGYHIANVVIHLLTALLLFGVVRRTLVQPRVTALARGDHASLAFAIALLWALHPLSTEAVDYMTQRTESLMALMFMLTLYASIRALEKGARARWQGAAVIACALGMACKESMVVAPVVVMLYDRIFAFGDLRAAVRGRWRLYGSLAASWLVLGWLIVPGPRSGSVGFSNGVTPWTYLLNQTMMIVRYFRLSVWPTSLVINYGPPAPLTLSQVWPHAAAIVALLMVTAFALVRWPAVGFLAAWVFLTLAPSSSLVPIATEAGAERRVYLSLMALVAGAVLAVDRLAAARRFRSPALGRVALLVTAAALGALTVARNSEYASALTLAQTTLARWPSASAHGMLGAELASLGRDAEALPELRRAADVDPRAHYNFGITLFNLNDDEGAIRELEAFARAYPLREEIPAAWRVIGTAFARQGNWAEAVRRLRVALGMTPADQATRRLLVSTLIDQGNALGRAGRYADAAASFRQALELEPSSAIARHALAAALYDGGDAAGALVEARRTVAAAPSHAGSYDVIGRALASQGRYDEAVDQLRHALRLDPNDTAIQDDLATVLAARAGSRRLVPPVK